MFFSQSTLNLAKVIPAMDNIDCHLTTLALNSLYRPAIKASLTISKRLLNRYYTLTDHSEMYHIALSKFLCSLCLIAATSPCSPVLHPSHKLTYLHNAGWSKEWIAMAKEIIKTEFERAYIGFKKEDDGEEEVSAISPTLFFSNLRLFLASDRVHFGQHIRQPPEPLNTQSTGS
jgi:hypothetical protein